MPTLLDVVYTVGLLVSSPYWLFRLAASPRYRRGLSQRLGATPRKLVEACRRGGQRPIWIHAASVGEVNAARSFVEELERRFPERPRVISCFTSTGFDLARQRYGAHRVFYFPLDLSWIAAKVLRRLQPACLVLVELELWPNVLRRARRRGVPVLVVNGRITDKTARRLRRMRFLLGPVGRDVPELCCVQTETYRQRFLMLGAPEERVRVTGTMKYDTVAAEVDEAQRQRLREELCLAPEASLVVGGSTWPGEEEILLAAYARLRQEWPDLRLLLAPRHIERAAEVERVVRAAGFEPRRRSQLPEGVDMSANARQNSVLILDTLGELVTAYALAVIAFVGKSLRVGGGHNVLEPAALGVPVAFGPHTENFQSEAETLLAAGAGEIVTDGDSLYQCIRGLLADEAKRRRMAEAGRRVVQENRGATRRNVDALAELVR